jgi:hypothetical protein
MAIERRRRAAGLAFGGLLFALGCASPVEAPVEPPSGGLFAWYSAPVQTNFAETPVGTKVGLAELHFLREPFSGYRVPVVTLADASVREAASNAFLRKIHYVDYQVLNVLGIYVQVTIRVVGD